MSATDLMFSPLKIYTAGMATSYKMAQTLQDANLRQMEAIADLMRSSFHHAGATADDEIPDFTPEEKPMREAFHRMADTNLRMWEHAADFLNEMPDWMRGGSHMPGHVMVNLFDKVRRNAQSAYGFVPASEVVETPYKEAKPEAKAEPVATRKPAKKASATKRKTAPKKRAAAKK